MNSGIPSTQQRVRESDDLRLNPLNQGRNDKSNLLIITKIILKTSLLLK